MRRAPRTAAAAALTGALLALAGCGVPTSGVIDVGAPAVGVSARTMLYFVAGGTLRPVPRRLPEGAGDPVEGAVRLLLAGPVGDEALKLTTALPAVPGRAAVTVAGDAVTVRFPAGVERLDTTAMEQLTCTAVRALRWSGQGASPSPTGADTVSPGSAGPGSALPEWVGPGAVGGMPTEPPWQPGPQPHVSVRAVGEGWATARPDTVCPPG
ncbi:MULTISPECIES: GerMN domain-containing protein [unclassified Streptomyces]|uniref:GerMN domain-containing protein n=1 Tax=unclassified Streptomyces TaxID=2593676 RepID=UPI0033BA5FC3